VMMLVLPTDWSPRNTSLYLASADTTAGAIAPPRPAAPPRRSDSAPILSIRTPEEEGRPIPRSPALFWRGEGRGGSGTQRPGHHDARTSVLRGDGRERKVLLSYILLHIYYVLLPIWMGWEPGIDCATRFGSNGPAHCLN
jgi:hypothetical protein